MSFHSSLEPTWELGKIRNECRGVTSRDILTIIEGPRNLVSKTTGFKRKPQLLRGGRFNVISIPFEELYILMGEVLEIMKPDGS